MRERAVRILAVVVALIVVSAYGLGTLPSVLGPAAPPADAPDAGATNRVSARVVRVVDGDTIIVELRGRDERVRYIGIDAPESVTPGQPVEPFGREASDANRTLVSGKTVWLEKDTSDTDPNGRLLRYVYTDGTFVNAELVRRGLAEAKAYRPDVKRQAELDRMEREARSARRGIWSAGD